MHYTSISMQTTEEIYTEDLAVWALFPLPSLHGRILQQQQQHDMTMTVTIGAASGIKRARRIQNFCKINRNLHLKMFYLIGLGLGDAKDITVKGLEIIKKCDNVFLEGYTSILTVGKDSLEEFYGRTLTIADRELCESGIDNILLKAKEKEIALLVVGDPLGATTHTDMLLRANEMGVQSQIVHNASIMNAVSCCGLQLYNFGETVSIPLWTDTWKPDSFFEKIVNNFSRNLHTLCLLDIKVKEPTEESLTKKIRQYMEPKFMTVGEAANQLIQIIENMHNPGIKKDCTAVGLSRVGASDQKIVVRSLNDMQNIDLGRPLHSLVIAAPQLHPLEVEYLDQFR